VNFPQFYGSATAAYEADEDGSHGAIFVEVKNEGCGGNLSPRDAHCALTVEAAAKLAEELDAAIDLSARTAKARSEAKIARISALKETLAELEAQQ
jgi:hypothetical protein